MTTAKKKLPRGIAEHRGKYRVRIVHKGESVSLGVYTTLTHAKGALAIARADIARGTFTTPRERKAAEGAAVEAAEREAARNRYTVDDLYRDFEEYEHSRGLTVSTIYSRESKYRVHARPVLGSMPVVDVTPPRSSWTGTTDCTKTKGTELVTMFSAWCARCLTTRLARPAVCRTTLIESTSARRLRGWR